MFTIATKTKVRHAYYESEDEGDTGDADDGETVGDADDGLESNAGSEHRHAEVEEAPEHVRTGREATHQSRLEPHV